MTARKGLLEEVGTPYWAFWILVRVKAPITRDRGLGKGACCPGPDTPRAPGSRGPRPPAPRCKPGHNATPPPARAAALAPVCPQNLPPDGTSADNGVLDVGASKGARLVPTVRFTDCLVGGR